LGEVFGRLFVPELGLNGMCIWGGWFFDETVGESDRGVTLTAVFFGGCWCEEACWKLLLLLGV
jgi:hypothetical protein